MSRALYQKMGILEHFKIAVINPPEVFSKLFAEVPFDLNWSEKSQNADLVHFFPKNIQDFEDQLVALQEEIDKNGMIWVS